MRIVVILMATFGLGFMGVVEFICIEEIASPDNAEMSDGQFAFFTAPIGVLLLLTGFALVAGLLIGEEPAKKANPDDRPTDN